MSKKHFFFNQVCVCIFQVKPNLLYYLISSRFIFLWLIFFYALIRFFIQQIFQSVIKFWSLFLKFIVVWMRFQKFLYVSYHLFFEIFTTLFLSYFQMVRLNWIIKINLHNLVTLIKILKINKNILTLK